MSQRYRVCSPRKDERTGKTYWTPIGSAWKRDTGAMSVVLDALPIGREIMIFPPDEGRDQRGGKPQSSQASEPEDDIQY